jgi:hypothetical protein
MHHSRHKCASPSAPTLWHLTEMTTIPLEKINTAVVSLDVSGHHVANVVFQRRIVKFDPSWNLTSPWAAVMLRSKG